MASVELRNFSVQFGTVTAVNNVSLRLDDGEFVVLLGPSGCGKTTTLRCIAGLEQATSGHILFDGREVEHLSPRDREVAMVFQFVSLYPHMSVRENIAFPLKARGERGKRVADKIGWVASIFGLSDVLDQKPGSLPPGIWQKASLARAVVREPRVLLLDEPLSAIDEQFREEMRWELRHLQKELGTTTIHVTHDQREAMSLADRVVLMRDGRIVQEGSPQTLYADPADTFAAFFIGSPSMNFLEATIRTGALIIGDRVVNMPPALGDRLAGIDGQIRVGIRPHDVALAAPGDPPYGEVEAILLDQYAVGREHFFNVLVAGVPVKGFHHDGSLPQGETRVRLDPEHLLFFAPDGERIRI